jgi:hypothetical protein
LNIRPRFTYIAALYGVLLVVSCFFFLIFFNRFSGARSGNGEYSMGVAFLSGIVPYRDYFSTGPPMNLFKSALLLKFFGNTLFVIRAAGVVERLLIAALLFRWLSRIFKPWHAMLASLVTIIISAGDRTDPIASYNHDAIFYAMLSGFSASFILSSRQRLPRFIFAAGCSGMFAALSLITKQTVGLGVLFSTYVVVAVLVFKIDGLKRAAAWCGVYALGAVVPLTGLVFYLIRLNALHDFLQMLFVKGPAAKASHASDFFHRELSVAHSNSTWVLLGLFALSLSWLAIRRSGGAAGPDREEVVGGRDVLLRTVAVLVAGGITIGCAKALSYTSLPAMWDFSKIAIYYTFIALSLMLFVYAIRLFSPGMTRHQAQCIVFCVVSWSVAFMLSLSWPAFEAMVLPGLGFLIAATLNGVRARYLPYVYGVLVLMVFMQTREKLDLPFVFDYQMDSKVRFAVEKSTLPQLQGMRLSKETVQFLDGTTDIIQKNVSTNDTIFTYPEMSIIYSLSGKRPPTVSWTHNIDVVNDSFAYEEAERVKRNPPAVIVYYRFSEYEIRDEEAVFRRGRQSGQRYLIAAVETLVSTYRLAATYRLAPKDPLIMVYVRQ